MSSNNSLKPKEEYLYVNELFVEKQTCPHWGSDLPRSIENADN